MDTQMMKTSCLENVSLENNTSQLIGDTQDEVAS
jgi:hypothetical protein